MWVVQGKTVGGADVSYKIPVGKDTDKAFVMAMAFQEHGKASPEDDLTSETSVTWTSDNVQTIPEFLISEQANFAVDKRIAKGVWERHSSRAFRTPEAATEALESAASEFPNDKFRIVATVKRITVIALSKNAVGAVDEKPDEAQPTLPETSAEDKGVEAKTPVKSGGPAGKKPAAKAA